MKSKGLQIIYLATLTLLIALFISDNLLAFISNSLAFSKENIVLGIIVYQFLFIIYSVFINSGSSNNNIASTANIFLDKDNHLSASNNKLVLNESLFSELSENVPGLIYQFKYFNSGESSFTYVSNAITQIFEVSIQDALDDRNKVFGRILKEDFDGFFQSIIDSKNNLSPWTYQFRVQLPNKGIRWLLGESNPTKLEDCIVWNGFIRDITEQKLLETDLGLSEQLFRGVFNSSAIGIALVNPDGTWAKVNNSLAQFLGYSPEELINKPFSEITFKDDIEIGKQKMLDLIEGKTQSLHYEKRYIHKNGELLWALLAGSIVSDSNGKLLYLVAQIKNITERKVAEEKLKQSIANLQGILDASTHVAIIGTDLAGKINLFNKGAENLLGYTPNEVIGIHTPSIYHLKSELEYKQMKLSEEYNREFSSLETLVYKAMNDEFESQEWTFVRKDKSSFPVQLIITSIKNSEKEIVGFLGVATDISLLKSKEEELQNLVTFTAEQNNRLVNFAHIVSHNLRSHSGNFSLLLGLYNNETNEIERKEILNLLKKASVQLTETVLNLNEVVVITSNVNEQKDILNLYNEIEKIRINLSGIILEKKIELINNVAHNVEVKFVAAYLESVLLNFITNSIKYSSPDRSPLIKLSSYKESHYNVLEIEDNGLGIDLKLHKHKLFGMYKTFHGNKDARGIGLFITKNQIDAMQGKIEVESEVNVGTKFKIFFNENIV